MKSATTASIGMPSPAIMMPVCPVARKVDFMPAARRAWSRASAEYFLPIAQSAATVRIRRPVRLRPLPTGSLRGGTRTSTSRAPDSLAAADFKHPPVSRAGRRLTSACRAASRITLDVWHRAADRATLISRLPMPAATVPPGSCPGREVHRAAGNAAVRPPFRLPLHDAETGLA
jgi:hypothetical protein